MVKGSAIRGIYRTWGGRGLRIPESDKEMAFGAGAKLWQTILAYEHPEQSVHYHTKHFNVQILNSLAFESITGLSPPIPVTADRYAKGDPLSERAAVAGDF